MSKPITIFYSLAQSIDEILERYLAEGKVNDNEIWLAVLQLLSKPFYKERLLFRNYARQ